MNTVPPARLVTPSFPKLYFIRHGETDWNRSGRLQGQIDVPINELGRSQAARNGATLRDAVPELGQLDFVASPLLRTCQTMQIVRAEAGLPIVDFATDPRLKEIKFGIWEGLSWDELKRTQRSAIRSRQADPFNFVVPDGESYAMLSARVLDWLNGIRQSTVVVAHGGTMRCLHGHAMGLDPATIPRLETPQDRIMVVEPGAITWL